MESLPKKFPEYLIMYKTLSKRIEDLELKLKQTSEIAEIQKNIKKYKIERQKIKEMFPEDFFEKLYDEKNNQV